MERRRAELAEAKRLEAIRLREKRFKEWMANEEAAMGGLKKWIRQK